MWNTDWLMSSQDGKGHRALRETKKGRREVQGRGGRREDPAVGLARPVASLRLTCASKQACCGLCGRYKPVAGPSARRRGRPPGLDHFPPWPRSGRRSSLHPHWLWPIGVNPQLTGQRSAPASSLLALRASLPSVSGPPRAPGTPHALRLELLVTCRQHRISLTSGRQCRTRQRQAASPSTGACPNQLRRCGRPGCRACPCSACRPHAHPRKR